MVQEIIRNEGNPEPPQRTIVVTDSTLPEIALAANVVYEDTDIILDTGSGPNIFKNPTLLTNITSRAPTKLGGINAQGPNMTITKQGDFGSIKDVYYHPAASTNVLSMSKLKDCGAQIKYDDEHDFFLLNMANATYTFHRKGCFSSGI
jgi:hypothetical protein